jgi:hypothetical protein
MINIRQKQNNDTEIILDDIQIAQLEALSNYLPMEQVAGYFKISVDDFLSLQKKDERVLRAYRKGRACGICKVAERLFNLIDAGNLTAIMFYLETQAGWSKTPLVETEKELPQFKGIKVTFKTPDAVRVKVVASKDESLKLPNINRSYSNVVIPTSLRVIETRAVA